MQLPRDSAFCVGLIPGRGLLFLTCSVPKDPGPLALLPPAVMPDVPATPLDTPSFSTFLLYSRDCFLLLAWTLPDVLHHYPELEVFVNSFNLTGDAAVLTITR